MASSHQSHFVLFVEKVELLLGGTLELLGRNMWRPLVGEAEPADRAEREGPESWNGGRTRRKPAEGTEGRARSTRRTSAGRAGSVAY